MISFRLLCSGMQLTSDVEMPMRENTLKHSLSDLSTLFRTLTLHARNGKFALIFGEPPNLWARGKTRVEEEPRDTYR